MEMEFGESSAVGGQNESIKLPLGFRFDPLPSELVFYLKLKNSDFAPTIKIPEVDLYDIHPKRLTTEIDSSFGIYGNGRNYYFTKRKRRDQRGSRVKRSMNEGYWKTTSKDKDITDDKNKKIGHCKTFKFFEFEGNDKKPTNWIMHEFRDLNTKSVMEMDSEMDASTSNENYNRIEHYVLCMIYERGQECPTNYPPSTQAIMNTGVAAIEEVRESSIPQNQSMVYASHPHEANSLMPNMDRFQLQPYFGNDNGFSTPPEFIDDLIRHLIEPDGENMHLDFLDPNPSHPHEANSMSPESIQPIPRPPGPPDYSNGFSTSHDASGNQNRPESIPSIPWNNNPMNQSQTQSDNKKFVEDPIMQPTGNFLSDSIPLTIPRPPGYSNGFSTSHDASGNQNRPEPIPSIPWNSNPMNQSQTQSDNNNFVEDHIMQPTFPTSENFLSDSIWPTSPWDSYSNEYCYMMDGISNGLSMPHSLFANPNAVDGEESSLDCLSQLWNH